MINASPDSLNADSIVRDADEARCRAELLIDQGAWGFDLGGQGSTFQATERDAADEWAAIEGILPVVASFHVPVSVDTWRPSVMRRALAAGATWMNAADGLQNPEMLAVAAEPNPNA